ncbi:unnamed protein product [Closterium sp. NIES-64]|nr:unnamed protein product [Closterium sp. NIES-64]
MPTVSVGRDRLFAALGKTYTEEEFDELCFEFGIELDDVTTEKAIIRKEKHLTDEVPAEDEEVIYKIEVPANRYDLLCLEGLARSLRIFLGMDPVPQFKLAAAASPIRMTVTPEPTQTALIRPFVVGPVLRSATALIRPFVVGAVLRNITFDQHRYNSFIDLQDRLHQNLCRRRTLVAIGTHDLDTLTPPFTYEALPPTEIKFVPLKQTKEFNAAELMEFYKSDNKLKKFLHIISESPVFPVIYDANRTVLSLPPVINGSHSAIKLTTRNVFIECTATDLTKAKIVLNTVVTMFSEFCDNKFEVEPVEVVSTEGQVAVYPQMEERDVETSVGYINKAIGVDLKAEEVAVYPRMEERDVGDIDRPSADVLAGAIEGGGGAERGGQTATLNLPTCTLLAALPFVALIARLLTRMQLPSKVVEGRRGEDGAEVVSVTVPPTRSDVLHPCDIMEDVAIAHGYNNIARTEPKTVCEGKQQPLNQLCDLLRGEVAQAGFTEVLTWALIARSENFEMVNLKDDGKTAVVIGNPRSADFEVDGPLSISLVWGTWALIARTENFEMVNLKDDGKTAVVIGNPRSADFEVGAFGRVCARFGKAVDIRTPRSADFEVVCSSLLPGMLKTLASNKDSLSPVKLSEVSHISPSSPLSSVSPTHSFPSQVVRSSLLPGMLKTLASNKDSPRPVKLFEVSHAPASSPFKQSLSPPTPLQVVRSSLLPGMLKTLASNKDSPRPVKLFEVSHAPASSPFKQSLSPPTPLQVVRSSLLPGMLKTLASNKDSPRPVKLFEVSDVCLLDESKDVGARNERRLIALYCNLHSGFEVIHGLVDRLMESLGVACGGQAGADGTKALADGPATQGDDGDAAKAAAALKYFIAPSQSPQFFGGRQADILCKGKSIGTFGVVHPEYFLDKSTPHYGYRWIATLVIALIYTIRVFFLHGYYIITYGLGIYMLNLLIGFLSPQVDPEAEGPVLPSKGNDEFKPFIRRLPEFKFWYAMTKAFLVAFTMTFFPIFDVPVFWPILLMYWFTLFVLTMKRQIRHMIKYKYVPFSFGKQKYKGGKKPASKDDDAVPIVKTVSLPAKSKD